MIDQADSDPLRSESVEAYLDSVEKVLLAAQVPRSERVQVLEDLTSQIADMLSHQPSPISDDAILAVLNQLEPPSQFAVQYGALGESAPQLAESPRAIPFSRAALVAAVGAACIALTSLILLTLPISYNVVGPPLAVSMVIALGVGVVVTPLAIGRGIVQLQAQPGSYRGRELVLVSALTYAVFVPIMLLAVACAITDGLILIPFGIVAFVYALYRLVQYVRHRVVASLPHDPTLEVRPAQPWRPASPAAAT